VGCLQHEVGSCRQQVIAPGRIGDFPEYACWDMSIVPGEECFERIRARGSVWTAVDNWGGEI
jgi:hypothetical protein